VSKTEIKIPILTTIAPARNAFMGIPPQFVPPTDVAVVSNIFFRFRGFCPNFKIQVSTIRSMRPIPSDVVIRTARKLSIGRARRSGGSNQ
jgi:hypothetical protein